MTEGGSPAPQRVAPLCLRYLPPRSGGGGSDLFRGFLTRGRQQAPETPFRLGPPPMPQGGEPAGHLGQALRVEQALLAPARLALLDRCSSAVSSRSS